MRFVLTKENEPIVPPSDDSAPADAKCKVSIGNTPSQCFNVRPVGSVDVGKIVALCINSTQSPRICAWFAKRACGGDEEPNDKLDYFITLVLVREMYVSIIGVTLETLHLTGMSPRAGGRG
jgi:hypothetical protein